MKKTLTLPESEIITLADAAKKHGTVELAKLIGVGKSQLYRILRGHNRVTPETADKISIWLNADAPQPEEPEQRPSGSSVDWNDPKILQIAAISLAAAISRGHLKNVSITFGGQCKCGD